MPFRRRRSSSRRGARPRTRWLALQPGSRTHATNNTYAVDRLVLQYNAPTGLVTTDMSEFVGGTILRVLFNVAVETPITPQDGNFTGWAFMHAGLFTSADVTPSATIWSPNVPAGDFMDRDSTYHYAQQFSISADTMAWGYKVEDKHVMRFDTSAKRRIRENQSLFVAWYAFLDDTVIQNIVTGWNGRVLIQLP